MAASGRRAWQNVWQNVWQSTWKADLESRDRTSAGAPVRPKGRGRAVSWRRSDRRLPYERWRILPRLIAVSFDELEDMSEACTRRLIQRLDERIAREARRARSGRWAYDFARHTALINARKEELARLKGRAGGSQAIADKGSAPQANSRPDKRTALLTGTNASCARIIETASPSVDSGKRSQN